MVVASARNEQRRDGRARAAPGRVTHRQSVAVDAPSDEQRFCSGGVQWSEKRGGAAAGGGRRETYANSKMRAENNAPRCTLTFRVVSTKCLHQWRCRWKPTHLSPLKTPPSPWRPHASPMNESLSHDSAASICVATELRGGRFTSHARVSAPLLLRGQASQ